MSDKKTFIRETEALRDLRTLEAIERDPGVSQRELASDLGVAVGVANACIRALVRKGLVKIRGTSNRSITYHLTKAGLLHKSVLAMEWTRNTLGFYAQARRQVADHIAEWASEGVRTIVLDGADELAEITALVSGLAGVTVVGVVEDGERSIGASVLGVPVTSLEALDLPHPPDAVVFCVEPDAERTAALSRAFPSARLLSLVGELPDVGRMAVGDR
jgi:DNA-binding Lrp family transcriptional regulator